MIRISMMICVTAIVNFGCAQKMLLKPLKSSENCLDYTYNRVYPFAFKFYKEKIIIGDGEKLIAFNLLGKETDRIVLPTSFLMGRIFLDFLPMSDSSYLITVNGNLYEVTRKAQRLLFEDFGEVIKGEVPIVITNFQEYDSIRNIVTNGIRLLNSKEMRIYSYPTKEDLGTANFEKVDEFIALGVRDSRILLLPIDTTKQIISFNLPNRPKGDYLFIGKNNNSFVFIERDFNKKQDHLLFFDNNLKFQYEAILDVSYDDISSTVKKDESFYMEAPFGNFYSFNNQTNTIFVFRHVKSGKISYFPIQEHLRIIGVGN